MTVHRTFRFTLRDESIRTQKLFSQHLDVSTPIGRIQGVSAYEGILEALLDVGTLEISTASSHGQHALFIWPHLKASRQIARTIQDMIETEKNAKHVQ